LLPLTQRQRVNVLKIYRTENTENTGQKGNEAVSEMIESIFKLVTP